jgi:hypothetical protein
MPRNAEVLAVVRRAGDTPPDTKQAKLDALGRVVNAPPVQTAGDLSRELVGTAILVALVILTTGGLVGAVFGALWLLS